MAILGKDIIVTQNGTIIAGLRSNEIQTEVETIEVASPSSGEWRSRIAGRKDWNVSAGYLVLAGSGMAALLSVGSTYTLRIGPRTAGGVFGTAILTTCSITATIGNLVQGSFKFEGVGPLQEQLS